MKNKTIGYKIEHGCYDCAYDSDKSHDRFYCLICKGQKCQCKGCDISLSTPTRWKQGHFDTSIFKNFEELNAAVVKNAVHEYQHYRKIWMKKRLPNAHDHMKSIEDWFRSGQCSRFTTLDGNMIMDRLKEEN